MNSLLLSGGMLSFSFVYLVRIFAPVRSFFFGPVPAAGIVQSRPVLKKVALQEKSLPPAPNNFSRRDFRTLRAPAVLNAIPAVFFFYFDEQHRDCGCTEFYQRHSEYYCAGKYIHYV